MKTYKKGSLIIASLLVLLVLVVPAFAKEPITNSDENTTSKIQVPVIVDGEKYSPTEFEATFANHTTLHYFVSEDRSVLHAFTTEEKFKQFMMDSNKTNKNQDELASPEAEFVVFYDSTNYGGFAAHVYNDEQHSNLGSLDDKASSLVFYTSQYVCMWDRANYSGPYKAFAPGSPIPDLGVYGWDNRMSSVILTNNTIECFLMIGTME